MLKYSQDSFLYDSFYGDYAMQHVKMTDLDSYDMYVLNLECKDTITCEDCPCSSSCIEFDECLREVDKCLES